MIEDEFAILDAVGAVGGESDVAVLVNAVGADDALSVLGREDLLDHGGAIAALGAGALDRVEDQTNCLVAVDGVAVGVLVAVLGFVVSEELLAGRRVLLRRDARDRDQDSLAILGGSPPSFGSKKADSPTPSVRSGGRPAAQPPRR